MQEDTILKLVGLAGVFVVSGGLYSKIHEWRQRHTQQQERPPLVAYRLDRAEDEPAESAADAREGSRRHR